MAEPKRSFSSNVQANLMAGVLTVIPIVVVWIVLDFVFAALFSLGSPLAAGVATFVTDRFPDAAPLLDDKVFRWIVAIVVALLLLYTIGATASRMIGMRLIAIFDAFVARIPFVQAIYSASKKLVNVLQQSPNGTARVVLVEFPHPGMRAIGLVMRTLPDAATGEELAAVYVPTAPNPTSGYLEFIPVKNLVPTDMTMDQAMSMIVSGGAVAPDSIGIANPPATGR